jgi:SAM-dependent methyltransferase
MIDAVDTIRDQGAPRRSGQRVWKRLAGRARAAAYRLATPLERLVHGSDPLRPPAHLRIYYYGTWDPDAFTRHAELTKTELVSRGLRPEHRVLDIGSGIGNLAIALRDYLRGGYDGIEIHPEAVDWCQRTITPRHPAFRFHRANLASRAYNPRGDVLASEYRFPFADASFDYVFLASVFTHMMPDAVEHYIHEISRVLTSGGICVETFFLLNDESRTGVDAGRSFMQFPVRHSSGQCRLNDAHVPEAAVALEEKFIRRIHDQSQLTITDVRRGLWWSGERHDQDVVTARKQEVAAARLPDLVRSAP